MGAASSGRVCQGRLVGASAALGWLGNPSSKLLHRTSLLSFFRVFCYGAHVATAAPHQLGWLAAHFYFCKQTLCQILAANLVGQACQTAVPGLLLLPSNVCNAGQLAVLLHMSYLGAKKPQNWDDYSPSFIASLDWLDPTIIAPHVFIVAAGFACSDVVCIGGLYNSSRSFTEHRRSTLQSRDQTHISQAKVLHARVAHI